MKVARKKIDAFAAMEELRQADNKIEVIEKYGANNFDIYDWEYISRSIKLDELFIIKYMDKLNWVDVYYCQNFDDEFHEMLGEIKENLPSGEYNKEGFMQAVDDKVQELEEKIMELEELKAKVAASL